VSSAHRRPQTLSNQRGGCHRQPSDSTGRGVAAAAVHGGVQRQAQGDTQARVPGPRTLSRRKVIAFFCSELGEAVM
jgi:hypothetical protein